MVGDILSKLLLKEAEALEGWCRQLSDDPGDFERRSWPSGAQEVVHLPTRLAMRRLEPLTLDEAGDRIIARIVWEPCIATPVEGDAEWDPSMTQDPGYAARSR